jgi:hypothetical protein
MARRKQRDFWIVQQFQKLDMFGYNIGFNIDGEDYHRTCAGTCASLLIFAWVGLIIHYLLNQLIF